MVSSQAFFPGFICKDSQKKKMKMNGAGIASAAVFMILVSMVRLGNKSVFKTANAEEDWVKRIDGAVKAANKAGAVRFKRPDR
jgi:hypothetical protein